MTLRDVLTSDEMRELQTIKPVNNVIKTPSHITKKIKKAKKAGLYKSKSIK